MNEPQPPSQFGLLRQFFSDLDGRRFRRALLDIRDGWNQRTLWFTLGMHDIRQRYRRSYIGPFWITLSLGITVGALGLLYGKIFHREPQHYIPYLASGYLAWFLISQTITDGTNTFISADRFILQLSAPLSIHVFKVIWTNLIIFAHNILIFLAVNLIYPVDIGWSTLLALPGLALIIANGYWVALLLGLLSARFRDLPLITKNIVHVAFFVTPILWSADMMPGRAFLLDYNPFYHFIEMLRAPLLGEAPTLLNWMAVATMTVFGWISTLLVFTVYRWRIAYWV